MCKGRVLWTVLMVAAFVSPCFAAGEGQLKQENAELKQRLDKLENELAELKAAFGSRLQTPQAAPKTAAAPKLSDAQMKAIVATVKKEAAGKKPVWSSLDIQLYGYLKADAAYDDSRTNPGNFVVWVNRENTGRNDNQFSLTANQSRFGMNITRPEENGLKVSGKAEVDFYGGDTVENKAHLQMRHAYFKMEWPEDNFSIIAGQTSDVFSPLVPTTLNYTVLWDAGNVGYRRPQIRFTKVHKLGEKSHLKLEGALARTIGDNDTVTQSGEDAGFPTYQGRASITFPLLAYKPTTFGVSGHWGEEEDDVTFAPQTRHFDTWSLNFDLTQPVNEWLTIKGEAFMGENLDTYFGGIGQGVNTTTAKEIGTKGGWIAASLGPWDKWAFNVGAGIEDVDAGDITATSGRTMNRSIFANAIHSLNKNTQVGVELSHWRTEYKGSGDADALRAQMSFIYKF